MLIIFLIFLFALGLIIGSFLNVLIYRLEGKKRKNLTGRSFCPHCDKQIEWYDNIPVFSWLVLQGRCRKCKKKISVQYPLVELATGLTFLSFGYFFLLYGNFSALHVINFIFLLFFSACLIAIFTYDLKHQIIPDEISYILIISGVLYITVNFVFLGNYNYLVDHLFSGILAGGFFFSFAAISKGKWMGGGDIKLALFMGLVLGWQYTLVALYIAFILGAVVGSFTLLAGKKKLSSKIPFGPFLVFGTMIGFLFGEKIISFYANIFL